MSDISTISDVASSISVLGLMGVFLYLVVTGRLKTAGHHDEVVKVISDERDRALSTAEKLQTELAANVQVNQQLADAMKDLTRTVVESGRGVRR